MYWPVVRHLPLSQQLAPPASRWLDGLPDNVERELTTTVYEVTRYRNPQTYHRVSGGRWEAMTNRMAGIFEARDRLGQNLYRLFAFFDLEAGQHGGQGPTLVLLSGSTKPNRSAMPSDVYEEILKMRTSCLVKPRPYRDLIVPSRGRGYIDSRHIR